MSKDNLADAVGRPEKRGAILEIIDATIALPADRHSWKTRNPAPAR